MNFSVFEIIVYFSIFIGFFAAAFYVLTFMASFKRKTLQYSDSELPKATVIIPAWNEENSVESTLESILSSDYPDFEVIFVDNNSKDNTYTLAKKFEKDKRVRVFKEIRQGKACAVNLGISKARGEIIFTMDADTRVDPQSMKKMARYFKNQKVMSVTPAMLIDKRKGIKQTILQRVQQIEYYFGIFLRKVFASLNAIYVAPGAFSAYRKSFFDKYGGYEEGNVVEDLEMTMRMQSKGYYIENAPTATIYTLGPSNFKSLTTQRIRWYWGLVKNFWEYRFMVNRKFGDLGILVLPIGWIAIFFSMFLFIRTFVYSIERVVKEIIFLNSVNFNFSGFFDVTLFTFKQWFFEFFSHPIVYLMLFTFIMIFVYLKYASNSTGKIDNLYSNLFWFFLFFGPMNVYWWTLSFFKAIFKKEVKWR